MAERNNKLRKVEISLFNTKEQTEEFLSDILEIIGISKSELSVTYEYYEQDHVQKLTLTFQSKDDAEKFIDYIQIGGNMEKYKFKNFELSQADTNNKRRFSTCSTDSFQLINDEKQSELIEAISGDAPSFNYIEDSFSQSSVNDSAHMNNIVEFYFDKQVRDNHLDIILLFLENLRKSGGGEYVEYKLDPKKRLLNIEYKNLMNKSKVLDKKMLKIKIDSIEYNITANEPLDIESFKPNKMVVILKNIQDSWLRDEIVNIYAENLVLNDDETNDISSITKSFIFPNTVYVKYKHYFDKDLLRKRYNRKKIINDINIECLDAFVSKIVLVKLFDKKMKPITKDLIEMYFTNKRRCGSESYLSIHEREPFLLLSYDSQHTCELICSRAHKIGEHELVVECLYNYELFDKELNELKKNRLAEQVIVDKHAEEKIQIKDFKEEKKEQEIAQLDEDKKLFEIIDTNNNQKYKADEKKKLNNSNKENVKIEESEKIEVKNVEPEKKEFKIDETKKEEKKVEFRKPFFKINSLKEPKIKLLKIFGSFLKENLEKKLNDLQSNLDLRELNDKVEIFCECTHDLPSVLNEYKEMKRKWENDIETFVTKYFDQFKIENLMIKYPEIVFSKVKFDDSKVNLKKLDVLEQNSWYEISGFADDVKKLIEEIEKEDVFIVPEEQVEDEITDFELYQIRILFVVKYIKKLKDKYPEMNVKINHRQLKVFFKGKPSEIKEAKRLCQEILGMIKYRDLAIDPKSTKFFVKKEVDIVNWLKEKQLECVLMANNEQKIVRMYFINFENAKQCKKEIEDEIIVREINSELREGISDKYTNDFIKLHSNDERVYIEEENGIIYISGFKNNAEDLFQEYITSSMN